MALPDALATPEALTVLTVVLIAGAHYQRGLTYSEYMTLSRAKVTVFPLLQRITAPNSPLSEALARSTIRPLRWIAKTDFDSFVNTKQDPPEDAEYYATTKVGFRTLWQRFQAAGGSPHLISSVKQRPDGQYSKLHFVWMHDDGSQTEVYCFADGAIYVHHETAITDPAGHLTDPQTDGDPKGVLSDIAL